MNTILHKYLVFIKLNRFITSYFGHAHIHLAGEEKYVTGNIAKPGGLLHTGRISTFVIATPTLSGN